MFAFAGPWPQAFSRTVIGVPHFLLGYCGGRTVVRCRLGALGVAGRHVWVSVRGRVRSLCWLWTFVRYDLPRGWSEVSDCLYGLAWLSLPPHCGCSGVTFCAFCWFSGGFPCCLPKKFSQIFFSSSSDCCGLHLSLAFFKFLSLSY